MNDQLQSIGKKLLDYIDYIAIALMVGVLGGAFYLYNQEKNFPFPGIAPQTPVVLNPKFTDEEAAKDLKRVNESFLGKPVVDPEITSPEVDINEDVSKRRLVQISMFDPQTVEDAERVELAVREDFNEAQNLARQNQYDQAIDKLNKILQLYPSHQRSRRLLDEMLAAKAEAEAGNQPDDQGAIN